MSKDKILIIDDDPIICTGLSDMLAKQGFKEVITASDGVEGLAKAKDQKPNLIILDIAMPQMDGYTFVQELKRNEELRSIAIIVLTGRDEMQELFKMEGINDIIMKPFESETFFKKINGILKK